MKHSCIKPLSLLLLIVSTIAPSIVADSMINSQMPVQELSMRGNAIRSVHKQRECKKKNNVCCQTSYNITRADFMSNGKTGRTFTIRKPGKYTLAEYIDFAPSEPGVAAIRILSDNVELDFCKNMIRQVNSVAGCIGVQVGDAASDESYENINISNGGIAQFTTAGILVEKGTQLIKCYYMRLIDCGGNGGLMVPEVFATPVSGGMIFRGTVEAPITNLVMADCIALFSDSGDQEDVNSCGLCLSNVGISYIIRSHFDDTKSLRIASGCQYTGLFDVNFILCTFNGTTGGAAAYGLANNGSFSVGYTPPLSLSERITVVNCEAKSITATDSNAFQASGIQMEAAINGVINHVIVQDITNQATEITPIDLPESNQFLPTNVMGINIGHIGSRNLVQNANVDTLTTSGGLAVAYYVGDSTFDCIVQTSIAQDILNENTTEPAQAKAIGYEFSLLPTAASPLYQEPPFGTSNICENCIGQRIIAPDEADAGTGIVLAGQRDAVVQLCNLSKSGRGMLISEDAGTNPVVITRLCDIARNGAEGNTEEGFLDTVGAVGNNTYAANYSNFNGVANSGSINYDIPFGNPIREWFAGNAPESMTTDGEPVSVLDNLSRRTMP